MKKSLAFLLILAILLIPIAGCGSKGPEETKGNGDEKLTYAFVSKTTADPMFVGTYEGFKEACAELGIECVYRGTEDASAEKEIEIINQMISQNVDGIAVIAADEDALQPVLKQAMDAGINVISVDSATNAESRELHVDFADPIAMGRNMFKIAAESCDLEGKITVLNGDPRVSLFADFDDGIRQEYAEGKDDEYKNIELVDDFAYGYDLPDQSTVEAQALIKNYPDTDVIICPTTVAILAAAKVIQDDNLDMKVTGIGLPSEMVSYFDAGICDAMLLWDIYEYGYLTAHTLNELVTGNITGEVGEKVSAGKLGEYVIEKRDVDGGTMVMMGDGIVFDIKNIHEWADLL